MSNVQATLTALKEGQLVLIHDRKAAYLAASTRKPEAVKKAMGLVSEENLQEAFVAIGEATQLYNYVTQIPDLAWDIMEYAEKSLHIVFDGGKGIPERLLQNEKIRIMLVLKDPLHSILRKLQQGILCLPVSNEKVEAVSAAVTEALALAPQTGCRLTPERIMELGKEGEVKFLKR